MNKAYNLSVCHSFFSSPIGELLLTSDGEVLTGLDMCERRGKPTSEPAAGSRRDDSVFQSICEQLAAYFRAELREFAIPLRMPGTPFQRLVWEGLQAIPYGSTVSYAELARRIGRPGASRLSGRRTAQPDRNRCSLSPRDCRRWNPGGIRWRPSIEKNGCSS